MVFFAITRHGFDELRAQMGRVPSPIWVAEAVLSSGEVEELRRQGVELTHFNHSIPVGDLAALDKILETIATHHPGESIWVECACDA